MWKRWRSCLMRRSWKGWDFHLYGGVWGDQDYRKQWGGDLLFARSHHTWARRHSLKLLGDWFSNSIRNGLQIVAGVVWPPCVAPLAAAVGISVGLEGPLSEQAWYYVVNVILARYVFHKGSYLCLCAFEYKLPHSGMDHTISIFFVLNAL